MYIPEIDHKGYIYQGWEDKGDDVIKIFHDIKTPEGIIIDGPWSPYTTPTREEFEDYIEWRSQQNG